MKRPFLILLILLILSLSSLSLVSCNGDDPKETSTGDGWTERY